jgi:hypothetical protein
MSDLAYSPEWDPDNQRFATPSRCPYPDCTSPVEPIHTTEPTLGWCAACERPYETLTFRTGTQAAPVQLNRRPDSAFCTYTGQPLTAYSVLDWCEAGGEPGRSYCLQDARGAVFGRPATNRLVCLAEDWHQDSVMRSRGGDDDDFVSSVSVVRGRVVAVTAGGWIGLFDAVSGEAATQRPLEWPTGSAPPTDPDRAVRHAPVFRGTQMVLAAPHEAQFRSLRSLLFAGGGAVRPPRMVAPQDGCQFLGPPLGIDGLAVPAFCLLEGRERADKAEIQNATLRFFDSEGKEIDRCPAPDVVRSPVFDRRLQLLVWVGRQGALSTLPGGQIGGGAPLVPSTALPDPMLPDFEATLRPSFAVVLAGAQGRSEAWLTTPRQGGGIDVHNAPVEEAQRRGSWRWQTQSLPGTGLVAGIAVGIGSSHRNNAASQLVAVATDRQVLSLDRANLAGSGRPPMTGLESLGLLGSHDVPLVCSAGVIARLQGSVCIDFQGLGWSDGDFQPKIAVPGHYQTPQGMAMFGRRFYIGHGMGVRTYLIGITEAR